MWCLYLSRDWEVDLCFEDLVSSCAVKMCAEDDFLVTLVGKIEGALYVPQDQTPQDLVHSFQLLDELSEDLANVLNETSSGLDGTPS